MTISKPASGLPTEQIHNFWREVETALNDEHEIRGDRAVRAILRYRDEVDGVGGMVYHQTPSDLANGLVMGGYASD